MVAPQGSIAKDINLNPALLNTAVKSSLNELPFPVSPAIRNLLNEAFAQVVEKKLNVTVNIQQLLPVLLQATEEGLQQAKTAAQAELFPQLTPGSVSQKKPEAEHMTEAEMTGLGEGEGEPEKDVADATPANGLANSADQSQPNSSGVSNRPAERAPGAFNMFGGGNMPQFEQEALGEQLKDDGKQKKPGESKEHDEKKSPDSPHHEHRHTPGHENNEQASAANLQQQRQAAKQQGSHYTQQALQSMVDAIDDSGLDPSDTEGIKAELSSKHKAMAAGGNVATKALQASGENVGKELKARIENGDFEAFQAALVLALIKDIIDFFDPTGLVPFLADVFVTGALAALLASQSQAFYDAILKKFVVRLVAAAIAEAIPGLEIVPTYTVMIIWMKLEADKRRQQGMSLLEKMNDIQKTLSKATKLRPPR